MVIDAAWYSKPEGIRERTSAGGVILRLQQGQYFLALVREGDLSGYFLPKGGVEAGEDLETAARREIQEEAGLKRLELVSYLGERQRLNFQRSRWVTTHYFLFTTDGRIGKPTDREHVYHCEWFPLHALPEMFWPEQRALVEAVHSRLAELLPG
ncbi:MAG: NUDIX hydrolase [Anaerolineales bacterium]|jgi:ADP-ribose pyrophosphatase YjhB (NUDIX family)|nr:NUDIX hydrolase [Anaerolineales bacterium]